jgi:hypothetical protein
LSERFLLLKPQGNFVPVVVLGGATPVRIVIASSFVGFRG